jgi:hypothetical protein
MRLSFSLITLVCVTSASLSVMASEPESNRASIPAAPPPAPELIHPSSGPRTSSGFHPRVILSDAKGQPVINSFEPVDVKSTCGRCHDVGWIASHGFHFGSAASARSVVNPAGNESNAAPNCLFCHVRHANTKSAQSALDAGNAQWVATATLLGGGLVENIPQASNLSAGSSFAYVRGNWATDGSVSADQLGLGPPSNEACGACHGLVTREGPKLADWLERPLMTERTGQVFSPARIIDSTMNLKGREQMARAWDVHAERLLRCSDCHFAQNDPRARALSPKPPDSLRFEPRHAGFAAFLQRPDHDFARGSRQVNCENCHEPRGFHGFLPHLQRHLSRLSCEVCHIPKSVAPALSEVDWSLPVAPDRPRLVYRGISGSLRDPGAYIEGFEPAIILRKSKSGQSKLAPVNLVTTWNWRDGSSQSAPIVQTVLNRALFDSQGHHKPELLQALDRNGNGRLDEGELLLDTKERIGTVVRLLKQAGVKEPRLVGSVVAESMAHGIVAGKFAIRSCTACHANQSRLKARVKLAESTPPGAELVYAGDKDEITLHIELTQGAAAFAAVKDTRPGYYVLGSSRTRLIDTAGLSFASLIFLGALTHGSLRIRAASRRRRNQS